MPQPGAFTGAFRGEFGGAGVDGQRTVPGAVRRPHHELHLDGAPFGQHQRCLQGEFLHEVAADLLGRAQGHLHEAGARQQDGLHDDVVGGPPLRLRRQLSGEQVAVRVGERHRGGEHRVVGRAEPDGGRVARAAGPDGQPVAAVLEGVRGQVGPPCVASGEQCRPVEAGPVDVRGGQRSEEPCGASLFPAQRTEHGAVRLCVVQGLLESDGQDGVGADLDEDGVAGAEQSAGGLFEPDGPAEVAVPVLGVHDRGVQEFTGHRGVQRHVRGARGDAGQDLAEPLVDPLHVGAVRGVVDVDPLGPYALGGAGGEQLVQCVGVAGDHDGRGSVDGRDGEPAVPAGDPFPHPVDRFRHRCHAAEAGEFQDRLAAQCHHAGGVVQGQRAGDAGGGDLALRVADDGGGFDAARPPQLGERHHHRPQRGLYDVDPVEARCAGLAAQHVEQRPVGVRRKGRRALTQPLGEHR